MQQVVLFGLLGVGTGALYALMAQGLIVIYRGSGVLNFAQGAIGMVGAYVQWELSERTDLPFPATLAMGIAASALIGALTHLVVMRPLQNASGLVRVIASLGVLLSLQAGVVLRYGSSPQFVPSHLPSRIFTLYGSVTVSFERVILFALACVVTAALWALYRYGRFGLQTTAVAENQRAAAALGTSPDVIATVNWALGSALAGLAAILIAPVITLQASVMTDLVLAALAGALVAGFRSFPIALVASLAVGIAQSELKRFGHQPGLDQAVPFIAIVLVLVLRGQSLPVRGYLQQRLPTVGTGRIRWVPLGIGLAVGVVGFLTLSTVWTDALTVLLCVGLILLSVVVITGYAGQLSLGQFALAGFGAWVAGRLAAGTGCPFPLAALCGVAATVPLGMLFALPAIRTRGLNLAVVTLGLGSALEVLLFDNEAYTGGLSGTTVSSITLFGWDVNSITHPARYGILCLVLFALVALMVGNLRRATSGRRLIATRTNERAAASLGVNVPLAKLAAFGISAGISALGGILLAFRLPTIDYRTFSHFTSITDTGLAMVGGIGSLVGPLFGAGLADGSVGGQVLSDISPRTGAYLPLIAGLGILLLVRINQNGIAPGLREQWDLARRLVLRRPDVRPDARPDVRVASAVDGVASSEHSPVRPLTLEVRGLTVTYGGTTAVDAASLTLRPGTITGLIGPNGAGKTSFIDAVTGFTRPSSGRLVLDGEDVTSWSPHRRARAGVSRSFQSLELFEDSTVLENLQAASDPRGPLRYVTDLIRPSSPPLTDQTWVAVEKFGLREHLSERVDQLPYGTRRLLALARAVATAPSVLLLDEPAAGLSEVEARHLATLVRELADDWGIAILLVEHDIGFVMSTCDDIAVLDFGRTIAFGTPDEVRRNPAVIASYLGEEPHDVRADVQLVTAPAVPELVDGLEAGR